MKWVAEEGEEKVEAEIVENAAAAIIERGIVESVSYRIVADAVMAVSKLIGGLLGAAFSIINAAGMVGLELDSSDAAGLNEQLPQSYLEMYRKKWYEAYNTNPTTIEAGIQYPYELGANVQLDYQTEMLSEARLGDIMSYATDYINALRVNSEGEVLKFKAEAPQSLETEHSSSFQNRLLWSLSAGNEDVFKRWKKYWWLVDLLVLGALALLLVPLVLYSLKITKASKAGAKKTPQQTGGVNKRQ